MERTDAVLDSSTEQRELWDQIAAGYRPEDAVETEAIASTLDLLQELAGRGTALEFAVGGGRIAVPLHRRGVRVAGMDVSPVMIDVLHAAVPAEELPATVGSMAADDPPGDSYQLIYVVYNAITCLLSTATDDLLIIDSYDLVTQRLFSHHYAPRRTLRDRSLGPSAPATGGQRRVATDHGPNVHHPRDPQHVPPRLEEALGR